MQWFDEVLQDVRGGARGLRMQPAFAVFATLTVAIGIGATTAVFGAMSRILLEDLPYGDPEELVFVEWRTRTGALAPAGADVAGLQERAQTLEDIAFVSEMGSASLVGVNEPEDVPYARVTSNFFELLQVRPAAGRAFLPDEGVVGPDDVELAPGPVVISHALWQRRFGGDPVLGAILHVNGQPSTIIGVLRPDFRAPVRQSARLGDEPDVWLPLQLALTDLARVDRLRDQDSDDAGIALARLAAGTDIRRVRADLDRLTAELELPAMTRSSVVPVAEELTRTTRPILTALFSAVVLVLLMACSNVAALMIARGSSRQHEMSVRQAIGASRARLMRQVLTESAVLATCGAILGTFLANAAGDLLLRMFGTDVPAAGASTIDLRVLGFTILVTVLATFLFGTAPAILAGRAASGEMLRAERASTGSRAVRRLREMLTVAQIALVVVLLATAAIVVQSVRNLHRTHLGFVADGAVTFDVSLVYRDRYRGPADRAAFLDRLEGRLAQVPGVEAVGVTGGLPLSGREFAQPYALGVEEPPADDPRRANFRVVTPGYLPAIGTRVLAGRGFRADDARQDRRVALVDDAFARMLARHGRVVGSTITIPLDGQWERAEVVGVVEQVRFDDVRAGGRETVYVPYRHEASRRVSVVVRSRIGAEDNRALLREAIRSLDERLVPQRIQPLQGYVAAEIAPLRNASALLALFGAAALLLAGIGLYGTVSTGVAQRKRELGVRMALGAQPAGLVGRELRHGMLWTAAGVMAGTGVVLAAEGVLQGLVYGVAPHDAASLTFAAGTVALVVFGAILVPARRAARVDPCIALRN